MENGWTNGGLAQDWMMKDFDPQTKEKAAGETCILMDGYSSHFTADFWGLSHKQYWGLWVPTSLHPHLSRLGCCMFCEDEGVLEGSNQQAWEATSQWEDRCMWKGGSVRCVDWTAAWTTPKQHTHTHFKTLTHLHPLYMCGASSSGFSRY